MLVTNAGVLEEWKPLADSDPDDWWGSWEINVRGAYLAARYATSVVTVAQLCALPGNHGAGT